MTTPATAAEVRAALDRLRADAESAGCAVVVVAAALSNGPDIADVHGSAGLEAACEQLAARLLGEGVQLLQRTAAGGLVAAVVAPPPDVRSAVERAAQRLRGFVVIRGRRVWPVITTALRHCESPDATTVVLSDVRDTLFDASRHHRGCVRWHEPAEARRTAPGTGDLELVTDLATALLDDPGQITMAYQPVFDLRSGALISSEALMRWRHPVRGPISPMLAVEAAEASGLIHALGRHVLALALAQTAAWQGRLAPTYRTHVNVSALELAEPGYVEHVAGALERAGVEPAALLLEITETALLAKDPSVLATLHRLRELGVGLGIDDFGTGYSSISHLQRLPVDTVKIDRSLVADIATSPDAFALMRTVIRLVSTSQVTVVVEGIEEAVQSSHLQAVGAFFGQGYLLGRPVPAEQFIVDHPGGLTA